MEAPGERADTVSDATLPRPPPGGHCHRPCGGAADARWSPPVGAPWQWQLDGRLKRSVHAPVYDVDGFETSAHEVKRLHRLGRHVVCYVNAGAWESWRPDERDFPASVLGRALDG